MNFKGDLDKWILLIQFHLLKIIDFRVLFRFELMYVHMLPLKYYFFQIIINREAY